MKNRPKQLTRNLKKTYLQRTEKLKMQKASPGMKQEEEKSSLVNITYHALPTGGSCLPSCTIQRNLFINCFVHAKCFSSSWNIFKKMGIPPPPIFLMYQNLFLLLLVFRICCLFYCFLLFY